MSKRIIIDNDCGIDDAWALNLFLNYKSSIDILGITCVNGNTEVDNVCHNNLYFLTVADRTEIPVFRGAEKPLLPKEATCVPGPDHTYFHGRNGFGDVPLPAITLPSLHEENGIVALQRLTSENSGEVSLICLGPLTNIALALKTYNDFKNNVKELYIMGGNFTALGNTTMSAEFNFHVDPEAAHIVLSEMSTKITLLPWETCLRTEIPFEWRDTFGENEGKIMSLLNKIEKPIIERSKLLKYKTYLTADQLLAAIFINENVTKEVSKVFATVELSGLYTRGQLVIDHLGIKDHNIKLIKNVDVEIYKEMLLQMKGL